MPARPSDGELVARCRAGDDAAWAELVDRFSRYVHAIARRGFRLDQDAAEDVFQEVFARTYEHLDRLRDDEAIRAWLAQLTRRLAIDHLRATRREAPGEDVQLAEADDEMERIDEALTVHQALGTLSESCREILDRFFARDQSYATISAELGIPNGTIASRISRCLGGLRERLEGRSRPVPASRVT